jgi:nicotinic acetylcholine receptor
VTFFPFDDQLCYLKFGSWTYSGGQIYLASRAQSSDLSNYIVSGDWDLQSIRVKHNIKEYSCCPGETYHDLVFYIHIRRRVLYYIVSILIPCLLLSAISVMTFWLPPDSGEKVALSITVLLSFSVFMLVVAENVPSTSETIPLIGTYLTLVMFLTSLSIAFTIFVLELHHSTQYSPRISPRVFNFLTVRLAPKIGLRDVVARFRVSQTHLANRARLRLDDFEREEMDRARDEARLGVKKDNADIEEGIRVIQSEWKLAALIVDRLLFWIFALLTTSMSVAMLVVVPLLKNAEVF